MENVKIRIRIEVSAPLQVLSLTLARSMMRDCFDAASLDTCLFIRRACMPCTFHFSFFTACPRVSAYSQDRWWIERYFWSNSRHKLRYWNLAAKAPPSGNSGCLLLSKCFPLDSGKVAKKIFKLSQIPCSDDRYKLVARFPKRFIGEHTL